MSGLISMSDLSQRYATCGFVIEPGDGPLTPQIVAGNDISVWLDGWFSDGTPVYTATINVPPLTFPKVGQVLEELSFVDATWAVKFHENPITGERNITWVFYRPDVDADALAEVLASNFAHPRAASIPGREG